MGLLDLPGGLFTWVDSGLLNFLSPLLRLIVWAVVASVVSMLLYKLLSAQEKLEAIKVEVAKARTAMNEYDGDADGLPPLILHSLKLSFSQIGITLGPAVISSLPALCLIVWISNSYGYKLPEAGDWVNITVTPADSVVMIMPTELAKTVDGKQQIQWPAGDGKVTLVDSTNTELFSFPLPSPVPVIHKEAWWNSLMGNPIGYLSPESKIEFVEFELQPQQFLSFGPSWLGSWETLFFTFIIAFSLAIKFIFKIH